MARNMVPRQLMEYFKDAEGFREIQRFFQDVATSTIAQGNDSTIEDVQGLISNLRARNSALEARIDELQGQRAADNARIQALAARVDEVQGLCDTGSFRARLGRLAHQIYERLPVNKAMNNTAWDDIINTGLGRGITTGTGMPSLVQVNGGGWAYDFDDAITANEKRILYDPQMPHGIKKGSVYLPHVHFLPSAIPGATQVTKWEVSVITFDNQGDVSSAGRLTTTTVYVPIFTTDTQYGAVKRGFYTSDATFNDSTRFKVTNANMTLSSVYQIVLRRKSGDAGDTYPNSFYLKAFDGHIEIDRRGTLNEFS